MNIFKSIVAILFVGWISFNYFFEHAYYAKALSAGSWRILMLLTAILYLGYYFYAVFFRDREKLTLKLSPLKIVIFFGVSIFLVLNYLTLTKPIGLYTGKPAYEVPNGTLLYKETEDTPIPPEARLIADTNDFVQSGSPAAVVLKKDLKEMTFGKTSLAIVKHIFFTLLEWTMILLWMYVWGSFIYGRYVKESSEKDQTPTLTEAFFPIGIGFFVVSTIVFLLATFGVHSMYSVFGAFIISVGIFFRRTIEFFQLLWKTKFSVELKFFSPAVIFGIFFVLFFVLNFIDNIRVFPNGWDSAERYINFAKIISESGRLISGQQPYSWEIFVSTGFEAFQGIVSALFLTFLGTVLMIVSFYLVLRKFFEREMSVMLSAIFYSIPFVFYQIYGDPKTDLPMLFFFNLGLLAFFKWKEKEPRNLRYLWLAFFLAGMAFSIKVTASLFILALLGMTLFEFFGWKSLPLSFLIGIFVLFSQQQIEPGKEFLRTWQLQTSIGISAMILISLFFLRRQWTKKHLGILALCGLFTIIPYSPWLIKGAWETKSLNPQGMVYGKNSLPYANLADLPFDTKSCKTTGLQEDYQRYAGFSGSFKNYVLLPWNLTMNSTAKGVYVDISFIFLAFLPLIFVFGKKEYFKGKKGLLMVFGILLWFLWSLSGKGVIWYGIGGLPFLLILLGFVLEESEKVFKSLGVVFRLILFFWILSAFSLRVYSNADAAILLYATGTINEHESLNMVVPGYDVFGKTFAADQSAENRYLLRIATPYGYFLPENQTRVISDQFLDIFSCIHQTGDDSVTLARLKEIGIKYILLDNFIPTIQQSEEQTLTKKYNAFVEFSKKNLKLIYKTPEFRNATFYEVP